jgi:hypothetical protein
MSRLEERLDDFRVPQAHTTQYRALMTIGLKSRGHNTCFIETNIVPVK